MKRRITLFNFPTSKFVYEKSAGQQAEHVLSEAEEVKEEIEAGQERSIDLVDLEMAGLAHSLETYWRIRQKGRGRAYVMDIFNQVIEKNRARGYYTEPEGS